MTDPAAGATPLPVHARNTTGLLADDVTQLQKTRIDTGVRVLDTAPRSELAELLATRRSSRCLGPLRLDQLATLLNRVSQPRAAWLAADGYPEQQSPVPSAGGRNPHTLLVLAYAVVGLEPGAWLLSTADEPRLVRSQLKSEDVSALERAAVLALRSDIPAPALIVTLARPRRTLSKYPRGEALMWKDAGALLSTMHLLAHDLGLASTILGTQGTVRIPIPGTPEHLIDTGAVALGSKIGFDHFR